MRLGPQVHQLFQPIPHQAVHSENSTRPPGGGHKRSERSQHSNPEHPYQRKTGTNPGHKSQAKRPNAVLSKSRT
ncbi:hypothetical protein CEXT_570051 [Caerostris extrusa]|uniref:Uncharacterized protein n=1 Tax=Caerostris extrusa TaxID=172846 RepID=A0AAV4XJK2_CAEEX|nr:hypothetical protein CEXT_570051 [Caerostris extrusa]